MLIVAGQLVDSLFPLLGSFHRVGPFEPSRDLNVLALIVRQQIAISWLANRLAHMRCRLEVVRRTHGLLVEYPGRQKSSRGIVVLCSFGGPTLLVVVVVVVGDSIV